MRRRQVDAGPAQHIIIVFAKRERGAVGADRQVVPGLGDLRRIRGLDHVLKVVSIRAPRSAAARTPTPMVWRWMKGRCGASSAFSMARVQWV